MNAGYYKIAQGGEISPVPAEILEKYNRPGPRYTSYPTAPEWADGFGPEHLMRAYEEADSKSSPAHVSLYLHLPFCRSLCLFCGCNVVISKRKEIAIPYLEHLKKELDVVSSFVSKERKVEQVHWGGGTPTYLTMFTLKTGAICRATTVRSIRAAGRP